jgi:succinate dehydrogenase/fumarate reductase cytochrome b subunit
MIKDRYTMDDSTQRVTGVFSFLFFVFPALFALVMAASIWAQAMSAVFRNFEEFKTFIMTIESAFAVYIGLFVYSLFQKQTVAKRARTG